MRNIELFFIDLYSKMFNNRKGMYPGNHITLSVNIKDINLEFCFLLWGGVNQ